MEKEALLGESLRGSFVVGRTQKGSDQWSVKMNWSFLFSGEEEREVTWVICWQWTGVKRSWCVLTSFVSRDGESARVICLGRGADIGLHDIIVLTDTTIGILFTITGDD